MRRFQTRTTRPFLLVCLLAFLTIGGTNNDIISERCFAQAAPVASPQSKPTPAQEEPIKVYTEEVLLPVFATDSYGRVDPTLELDDLLVLEDGVPQVVRSVRRIPANILLLLDTAGAENPAMRTNATRNFAIRLVSQLRSSDSFAAIQFGGRVELIQGWTTEREALVQSLKEKIFSGSRARLTGALAAAVAELKSAPVGNRHVVLFSDGADSTTDDSIRTEMVEKLLATQATVHVISYTVLGRKKITDLHPKYVFKITREKRKSAVDTANELTKPLTDPETLESKLYRKIELTMEGDWRMWARSRKYAGTLKMNEQWLTWLAEQSGGSIMLPQSTQQLPQLMDDLAREIDSQYVVTYKPKLGITLSAEQMRKVEVISRRVGLHVHSRRSYIITASQ